MDLNDNSLNLHKNKKVQFDDFNLNDNVNAGSSHTRNNIKSSNRQYIKKKLASWQPLDDAVLDSFVSVPITNNIENITNGIKNLTNKIEANKQRVFQYASCRNPIILKKRDELHLSSIDLSQLWPNDRLSHVIDKSVTNILVKHTKVAAPSHRYLTRRAVSLDERIFRDPTKSFLTNTDCTPQNKKCNDDDVIITLPPGPKIASPNDNHQNITPELSRHAPVYKMTIPESDNSKDLDNSSKDTTLTKNSVVNSTDNGSSLSAFGDNEDQLRVLLSEKKTKITRVKALSLAILLNKDTKLEVLAREQIRLLNSQLIYLKKKIVQTNVSLSSVSSIMSPSRDTKPLEIKWPKNSPLSASISDYDDLDISESKVQCNNMDSNDSMIIIGEKDESSSKNIADCDLFANETQCDSSSHGNTTNDGISASTICSNSSKIDDDGLSEEIVHSSSSINEVTYELEDELPPVFFESLIPWNDDYILPLVDVACEELFMARQHRSGSTAAALDKCYRNRPEEYISTNNDATIACIKRIDRKFKSDDKDSLSYSRLNEFRHIDKMLIFDLVYDILGKVYVHDDDAPDSSLWMDDVFNQQRNKTIKLWRGSEAPTSLDLVKTIVKAELRLRQVLGNGDGIISRRTPFDEWARKQHTNRIDRLLFDDLRDYDTAFNTFARLEERIMYHANEGLLDELVDEVIGAVPME